jgi:hypothetical protein
VFTIVIIIVVMIFHCVLPLRVLLDLYLLVVFKVLGLFVIIVIVWPSFSASLIVSLLLLPLLAWFLFVALFRYLFSWFFLAVTYHCTCQ